MKSTNWIGAMVVGLAMVGMVQGQEDGLLLFDGIKCAPLGVLKTETNMYAPVWDENIGGKASGSTIDMEVAEIVGFGAPQWSRPKIGVTNDAPVLPGYYTDSGVRWNNGAIHTTNWVKNHSANEGARKWVKRDFSSEVSDQLPMEEVLYFRVMLTYSSSSIFNAIEGGTSDQATQGLYGFGAGYGTTVVGMLNQNGSSGYPSEDQASMLFLFSTTRPSASDPEQGDLIFRVSDAAHYTTVSTNGAEYVMVENVQPNVPYFCLVEVRPDAGENGKGPSSRTSRGVG